MFEITDLAPIVNKITKKTDIVITEPAQQLIVDLINSIEIDPQETWNPRQERLEIYYSQWQDYLYNILLNIIKDNRLSKQMTTIDIVYWTGNNLHKLDFLWELTPQLCFPGESELPFIPMLAFPWNLQKNR